MRQSLCFIDSNVWLYRLLDSQAMEAAERQRKREIARVLTEAEGMVVSTQVVNEVCANALKKAAFAEGQIKDLVRSFEQRCIVTVIDTTILANASDLRVQYGFSFWDGLCDRPSSSPPLPLSSTARSPFVSLVCHWIESPASPSLLVGGCGI